MRAATPSDLDRLSPMDAAFLDVEDDDHGMHLSALLTFDGAPPTSAEFRQAIEGQLPHLPRFRQRVLRVPFALGRPVWVDAHDFAASDHLGEIDLDPGNGLAEFAAEYAQRRLDPDKPLWDIRLVRGLSDHGWALAMKLHHAMVDGLSIMSVLGRLFSAAPDAEPPSEQSWSPAPSPGRGRLLRATLRETVSGFGRPRRNTALLRSALTLRPLIGQAPRTALTGGRPGPERRTSWLPVPLAELKAIRTAVDGTVNDVVLAGVAGALRRYLTERGDDPRRVFTFVPVSLRPDGAEDALGNRIGLTFPGLPVDVADRRQRVREIQSSTARPVQLAQAGRTASAIAFGGLLPAFASRLMNRFVQLRARVFSLTCTNVPGPQQPVYFCGRRLVGMFGSAPLTSEHAMTVAALSYDGTMFFSVTHDPRRLPDGAEVTRHLRAELDALLADLGADRRAT